MRLDKVVTAVGGALIVIVTLLSLAYAATETHVNVLNALPAILSISMPDEQPQAGVQLIDSGIDLNIELNATVKDNNGFEDLGSCTLSSTFFSSINMTQNTVDSITMRCNATFVLPSSLEAGSYTLNITANDSASSSLYQQQFTFVKGFVINPIVPYDGMIVNDCYGGGDCDDHNVTMIFNVTTNFDADRCHYRINWTGGSSPDNDWYWNMEKVNDRNFNSSMWFLYFDDIMQTKYWCNDTLGNNYFHQINWTLDELGPMIGLYWLPSPYEFTGVVTLGADCAPDTDIKQFIFEYHNGIDWVLLNVTDTPNYQAERIYYDWNTTEYIDVLNDFDYRATCIDDAGNNDTAAQRIIEVDNVPPAPITDLSARPGGTNNHIIINWTAVGDDGMSGGLASVGCRYSLTEITLENFDSAIVCPNFVSSINPENPGDVGEGTIDGNAHWQPGDTVYFMFKATDNLNHKSYSNLASALSPEHIVSLDYDSIRCNITKTNRTCKSLSQQTIYFFDPLNISANMSNIGNVDETFDVTMSNNFIATDNNIFIPENDNITANWTSYRAVQGFNQGFQIFYRDQMTEFWPNVYPNIPFIMGIKDNVGLDFNSDQYPSSTGLKSDEEIFIWIDLTYLFDNPDNWLLVPDFCDVPLTIDLNSSFTLVDTGWSETEIKSYHYLDRSHVPGDPQGVYWQLAPLGAGSYNLSFTVGEHQEDNYTISRVFTVEDP